MAVEWSERHEESLMQLVKEYPWLYDCKHRSYKDRYKKRNSWMEIAKFFGDNAEGKWCNKRCFEQHFVMEYVHVENVRTVSEH